MNLAIRQTQVVLRLMLSTAAMLILAVPDANAQRHIKHCVTLDDLKSLKEVTQLQVSPDGSMVAYTIDKPSEIWLVGTQRGSVPRKLGKGTFPVFSPDNRRLAYYSSASGSFQLWVLDLASRRAEQVTHLKGGIQPDPATWAVGRSGWIYDPLRYAWSPDSKKIVFPSQVAIRQTLARTASATNTSPVAGHAVTPFVLTLTTPPEWTLAGLFRVGGFGKVRLTKGDLDFSAADVSPQPVTSDQLFIVDISAKVVTQLTRDSEGYFTPDWSPDGQKIVCVSNEGHPLDGGQSPPTNLYVVDVTTGKKSVLTRDPGYKRIPSWSPDGKSIAFFGASAESPSREYVLVISGGGNAVNVSLRLDRRPFFAYWSPDSKSLVVNYKDGADIPIARIDVATGVVEKISEQEGAGRFLMATSRSGTVAWSQNDASGPAVIHLLPWGQKSSHAVVNLNPQIRKWEMGVQEIVTWKNAGGHAMEGVLITPPGRQKGRRYPLIVDAYPKLGNGFKGDVMWGNQALASRGYAVFFPNGDGPHVWENPWKSMMNNSRAKGSRGVDVAVDDVMSGVDELIRRGIVDSDRMCLYGFSNGGGIVNQVVTKSRRFKCAVSVAGAIAADWSSLFFLRTQAKFIVDLAGTSPWENPQAYSELSAVFRLNNVTTPMLLADGDDDGGFLLGTIEMYNGLRYLGKQVTLLRYPKQGHGFNGRAMNDFWRRENAFFDKYLKPNRPND